MKKRNNILNIKRVALNYIKDNYQGYILTSVIFIIGLFIGVIVVNNLSQDKVNMISDYIIRFINNFKQNNQIDIRELFIISVRNNLLLTIALWIAGTTVIGMPIVIGLILYRGFCLGYTISAFTLTLGVKKSIIFCFLTLFLQNIIFIPAIITLVVSSIKLYKSIIKDRRKENIKIEIIRHTLISFIILMILFICSFIENNISVMLLKWGIKYIM